MIRHNKLPIWPPNLIDFYSQNRDLVRKIKSIVTCYQFEDGLKDNYCVMGLEVPSAAEAALILELEYAQAKMKELDEHRCY